MCVRLFCAFVMLNVDSCLQVTLNWAWSKGPLSSSGNGALSLAWGSLDEIFLVRKLLCWLRLRRFHMLLPVSCNIHSLIVVPAGWAHSMQIMCPAGDLQKSC